MKLNPFRHRPSPADPALPKPLPVAPPPPRPLVAGNSPRIWSLLLPPGYTHDRRR